MVRRRPRDRTPSGSLGMNLVLPLYGEGQRDETQLSFPAPALVLSCSCGGWGNIKQLAIPLEPWAEGLRKQGFGPGEGQGEGWGRVRMKP